MIKYKWQNISYFLLVFQIFGALGRSVKRLNRDEGVKQGDIAYVLVLLARKVNVNAKDKDNDRSTALDMGCKKRA